MVSGGPNPNHRSSAKVPLILILDVWDLAKMSLQCSQIRNDSWNCVRIWVSDGAQLIQEPASHVNPNYGHSA